MPLRCTSAFQRARRALPLLCLPLALLAGATHAAPGATLRGQVFTADGRAVEGLRATARVGAAEVGEATVGADGRFAVAMPRGAGVVELLVDAEDPARRRYHPALVRLAAAERGSEQRLVLVPTVWEIDGGRFAGRRVPVSPVLALTPTCAGCPSFYIPLRERDGADRLRAWPDSVFPLRLAFDRAGAGGGALVEGDSARFWHLLDRMQHDFGLQLFRPARYAETVSDDDDWPTDVALVRIDPRTPSAALTVAVTGLESIEFAAVRFRGAALIREADAPRLVGHEAMHVLGLGHTCAWRSLLSDRRCPWQRAPAATPEDVAYTQLLLRVRALQQHHGAAHGILAASRGEALGAHAAVVTGHWSLPP
jgi:hypothetical protein